MNWAPWTIGALLLLALLIWTYTRLWSTLFGAWYCTGWFGKMAFWTKAGARRYRERSMDPYCRGLQGPIVFRPGLITRRKGNERS